MTLDPRHARLMTPGGTRDFLPGDAARKLALEEGLRETFRRWGYLPVVTPTAEHLETVMQSNGHEAGDKMYRLFDREGHALALRPELTTPIARLHATRYKDEPCPVRLQYVANVFRHEPLKAGRSREFWQAGVELVGAPGPAADAEIVALAVEALEASGLSAFRVEIGHVEYFNGLLDSLSVPKSRRRALRRALLQRDYVGFEAALGRGGSDSEGGDEETLRRLRQLPRLRGGADVVRRALAEATDDRSRAAAEDVMAIFDELSAHGVAHRVQVDFGMIKDLDYYTGMVLEGYTEGIGFPVCTGGRYDNLIERFGLDRPATGFVLGVERVLAALAAQGRPDDAAVRRIVPDRLVFYGAGGRDRALAGAAELRRRGLAVEVDVMGRDRSANLEYARARGVAEAVFVPGSGPVQRLRAPLYETEEAMTWP